MAKPPSSWYPKRGEVYLMRLDKDRPALIISSDVLNRHALDVCVVPITSVHHGRFALRVAIAAGDGGLRRESWAKCDQVTTLEKQAAVYPPLGRLSVPALRRVEDGIKLALDLA
ncbi:MAG TPA: type II toxin-antitoxin system PemK/MazF family toxin [Candidatus Sulfotelmatobacter sp.]|jgi:mRNA interferase MazF|nr:type II toxin-antitoxin system PemK/MazF family toxin [Candidatus Sulfotelmatobacter sp.]